MVEKIDQQEGETKRDKNIVPGTFCIEKISMIVHERKFKFKERFLREFLFKTKMKKQLNLLSW